MLDIKPETAVAAVNEAAVKILPPLLAALQGLPDKFLVGRKIKIEGLLPERVITVSVE